jgi:hypothetical protein
MLFPFEDRSRQRTSDDFDRFSLQAIAQKDVFGHFGPTILSQVFVSDLPNAIIVDYLHTTLLRQLKTIIAHLRNRLNYKNLEKLNASLEQQKFPHIFNRRLPSLINMAYMKGSELRNLLLYALLPRFLEYFDVELSAFLSLLICGVRLLHGSPVCTIGREGRQKLAGKLLAKYVSK